MGAPLRRINPRPGVTWATAVAVYSKQSVNAVRGATSYRARTFFLPKVWTDMVYLSGQSLCSLFPARSARTHDLAVQTLNFGRRRVSATGFSTSAFRGNSIRSGGFRGLAVVGGNDVGCESGG